MDNETMHQSIKLEQNTLKNFFKQFIEETKNSTENKTQIILSLLSSIKEETELQISKGNNYY
jgi:cytoplasmic iron level regulating protein YaaA (DUF328/UPF0246 family)